MLASIAARSVASVARRNSTGKRIFCAHAVPALESTFHIEVDREQPFSDAADIAASDRLWLLAEEHRGYLEKFPIIEPQFVHTGQVVMHESEYTIDCSDLSDAEISVDNIALCDEMKSKYSKTGLLYLSNTGLSDLQAMRRLAGVLIPSEIKYEGGSNWRNFIEPNVYDTGAPKEAFIHYHHEMAYVKTSPTCLAFCAKQCLPDGRGSTFVSDQVQATDYLLGTPLGKKLKEKGICYVRCLTDEVHYRNALQSEFTVYNHWQKSFGTQDPQEAEEHAAKRGLQIEWDLQHPQHGRYMKTKFYADVFEYFEPLDCNILFASIADHSMWFDTWPGLELLPLEERPLKITFGDGTDFTYDELKQFVDVYDRFGIELPWKVGDIAVMCNYRWAHGRPQYDLQPDEQRELGVVLGAVFERQGQRSDRW